MKFIHTLISFATLFFAISNAQGVAPPVPAPASITAPTMSNKEAIPSGLPGVPSGLPGVPSGLPGVPSGVPPGLPAIPSGVPTGLPTLPRAISNEGGNKHYEGVPKCYHAKDYETCISNFVCEIEGRNDFKHCESACNDEGYRTGTCDGTYCICD